MLFTNIQLDDFTGTLARFLERLEMEGEGVEEREWVMMGITNLGAVLEYGRASSVVRRAGGFGGVKEGTNLGSTGVKVVVKRATTIVEDEETKMDIDDGPDLKVAAAVQASPATSEADETVSIVTDEYPAPFKLAVQLTFSMLSHVLKNPTQKTSPFARSTLNPYLTIVSTFLATLSKHPGTLAILERSIPWDELAKFFATIPQNVMVSQDLNKIGERERWIMLTSSCAPPLSEDWCLRGMEWVGRRVFERGYWKSGEEKSKEVEVLDASEGEEVTDGIIEDEDEDESASSGSGGETLKRWTRIVRCAVGIAQAIDGFRWVKGTRDWRIEGTLERKVQMWKEEARTEREAEERRRRGTRWANDAMEIDEEVVDESSEESEDDEDDTVEVRALKVVSILFLRTPTNEVAL
jgi:protein SMG6